MSFFCPPGTTDIGPKRVRSGYYTVGGSGAPSNDTRTNEVKCEKGYWCAGGIKQPCPVGSYGRTKMLTSARCSGVCPAGFACPEATIEPIKCLVSCCFFLLLFFKVSRYVPFLYSLSLSLLFFFS